MRIRPLILALVAAPFLPGSPGRAAEPAPAKARAEAQPITGSEWERAARLQAQKEALSPESTAAIERTRRSDPDAGPTDSVDVIGVDDGKPKRGQSQRRDGGPVTWIDGNCFYAAPSSMFETGAATRLWMPTCKPGSPRVLTLGRTLKPPVHAVDSVEEPKALPRPAETEAPRENTGDPR